MLARRVALVVAGVIVLSSGVALLGILRHQSPVDEIASVQDTSTTEQADTDELLCVQTEVDDACIFTEVVASSDELRRGLSGRESLPEDHGMLFDFGQTAEHCMWMPDMAFAIDIVWLDADQRIVTIKPDITPETYPESFCGEPAAYVLEVNSGVATERDWHAGQQLLW